MSKRRPKKISSLRKVKWKRFLRAPDAHLLNELYVPALSRAVRYDRCCAYFSSHVLSVAARGFGKFIQNLLALGEALPKPAARLIVNEQLDSRDLAALLTTSDQGHLIEKLIKQFKTPKDALEKNRMEMLAWLVAEGWLDVRVGLMRQTRGISHAKFGIITDIHGDCITFMGSDNETGDALIENYEELEIRTSWQDKEFTDYYRERFDALWEDRDEHVTTLPLPDAVELKLIKLATKEPPVELNWDKHALATAMLWHFIAAAAYLPDGEYACDATAMIDVWPHQHRVIDDTAKAFPAGRLLCDEVGMGKTIEAVLVLRRLLCGRGVKRVLLLVPAGLLKQWQDELREKGGLLVSRWENGYLYLPNGKQEKLEASEALLKNDILLVSREWARLEDNRELVLGAPMWDLVLLDEAHAARRSSPEEREFNSGNLLLQLLREFQLRQRARGILLLSATPMQTQPWEPWDLLSVLGVGGRWMVEFADIREYYGGIEDLKNSGLDILKASAVAHLVASDEEFPALPNGVPITDPAMLRDILAFSFGNEQGRFADWLRRGAPLGRRMHRNTRDTLRQYHAKRLLDYPLPRREVHDKVFDYQAQAERDCYNAIKDYINERYNQLESEKKGKGFVMTIYRRRMSSSPLALHRSLRRRLELCERVIRRQWFETWWSPEDEETDRRDLADADMDEHIDSAAPSSSQLAQAEKKEIESLLEKLNALGAIDSKFEKFLQVLKKVTADGRSVLVFTEYTDTMEYLREQLRSIYGNTLGCYSGDGGQLWNGQEWMRVSKADITGQLTNGELKVLICTDAASEGLNLQAASALINYDLPWNPSKVEQRIGRIDRIGQQQEVIPVYNLFLADSVDMHVYRALRKRCGLFEHFVGRMQPVLALARDALRRNLHREEADAFLDELEKKVREVDSDKSVANTFIESYAEEMSIVEPPATRQEIELALTWLGKNKGNIRAKQVKGQRHWRLSGLGKHAIEVTTDRETLERDKDVIPMTVCSDVLQRMLDRLPLPSRVPLVIEGFVSGFYRCLEARWVQPNGITVVRSAKQLIEHIESWDGILPPPALIMEAQNDARKKAQHRVEQMMQAAKVEEEANLKRQVEAAHRRLIRELARTLRCMGSGSLDALLREQVRRETRPDGRYHRVVQLLRGFPTWTSENVTDANTFVDRLGLRERQARIAGSEVDAALNDPRWRAMDAEIDKFFPTTG